MAEAKKVATKKTLAKKTSVKANKATPKVVKSAPKVVKNELKTAEKVVAKETTKKIKDLVETEVLTEAIIEAEQKIDTEIKPIAKAGKRSPKAIKEAELKAAKEERKTHADETVEKSKAKPVKVRSRLERKGKKYRKVAENIQSGKEYSIKEALDLAIKTSTTKFDSSVDMHIRLGVDPRQADQNIRASIVLPSGTGKKIVVAVFADTDDIDAAKKAGADIALGDELLQKLDKNIIDFDVLISTPSMMQKLGKYARVLGPKGLMPSPKSGSVTTDVSKAVSEAKAGRVEYRVDSTGIVHVAIGKVSFGTDSLLKNAMAILNSIKSAKPASIKGSYVKSIYVATSMGPSIKIISTEL